jgi:hypothetical protein
MRDTEWPYSPVDTSASPSADGDFGDTGKSRGKKARPRKIPKAARSARDQRDPRGSRGPRSARGSRFTRTQLVVVIIIFVVLFDVAIFGAVYINNRNNPEIAPRYYSDPYTLIQGQMSNNVRTNIYQIGYDLDVDFADYPSLTIANTSSLKLIKSNLLRSGAGPNGEDVFYDEQIIGRILRFNSGWASYRNYDDPGVLSSVQAESPAQAKLNELGPGAGVAFHQLTFGEMRYSGKYYYILALTSYTLVKDGRLDLHESLFAYKLIASPERNTMIIVDFEQLPLSALPPPQNDFVDQNDGYVHEEPDAQGEEPTEEQGNEQAQTEGEGESEGEGEEETNNGEQDEPPDSQNSP